jgi:CxxC-x17-CxxC domain-containing protein
MPDAELTCVECKELFLFSEKDQEEAYRHNLMAPQRCPKCRSRKRVQAEDSPARFEIVCDNCGKHDHVPFQPKEGRTVLCKQCHSAQKARAGKQAY